MTVSLRGCAIALLMGACWLNSVACHAATLNIITNQKNGAPIGDVVVYLDPVTPTHTTPAAPNQAAVAQSGMQFAPYVTVVRSGASVTFPNLDAVDHHVKSFSPAKEFELKISAGTLPPVVFDQTGIVALNCTLHDWMRGYVVVLDSPFYLQLNGSGRGALSDIPPGSYVAHAWHPDLGTFLPPLEQMVTIGAGDQNLEFDFPLNARQRKMPTHM